MAYSNRRPLSQRYQEKIAEEESAKQADADARKSAAREQRQRIGVLALEPDFNKCLNDNIEHTNHPTTLQHRRKPSDLPEVDTRRMPSLPVRPAPFPSPPISSISPIQSRQHESRYASPGRENALISQLQSDLGCHKTHVEKLEKDLLSTKNEIKILRDERDALRQAHIEAIRKNDREQITNLKEQISHLSQELDDSRKRERTLEDEVDEGRSRERDLRDQLNALKRERVDLTHEIDPPRSPRSPMVWSCPESRPPENEARQTISSRRGPKLEKKYEFRVGKGRRCSSATLVKSYIQSRA